MKFKGDIIITDPCYIMRDEDFENVANEDIGKMDDWEICEYGSNMERLGFKNYLTSDTEYGDWSCTTYKEGTKEKLGSFCADAGLVSVFLLEDVLKYNPKYDDYIKNPHSCTLIKDFDGDVEISHKPFEDDGDETEVSVIGKGNINFYTAQTGF